MLDEHQNMFRLRNIQNRGYLQQDAQALLYTDFLQESATTNCTQLYQNRSLWPFSALHHIWYNRNIYLHCQQNICLPP